MKKRPEHTDHGRLISLVLGGVYLVGLVTTPSATMTKEMMNRTQANSMIPLRFFNEWVFEGEKISPSF